MAKDKKPLKQASDLTSNEMWMEWDSTRFWVKAFMHSGLSFLSLSEAEEQADQRMFDGGLSSMVEFRPLVADLRFKTRLSAYYFVMTIGMMLRVVERASRFFPQLPPALQAAPHLASEGKSLRDMYEHAWGDRGYLEGRGRHQDQFVRTDDQGFLSADAISTIITSDGILLGNRLNVQRALSEGQVLLAAAESIPQPRGR